YLTAGNYYATRVPDLPGSVESYEGYLSVFVKDEANGQSIQVNLNNAQGDLGYLTAGNYYATRVPDLPGSVESYEGYLSVFVKD
ncbi:hypothetical protein WCN65_15195, partial [Staphylococcus aureus]